MARPIKRLEAEPSVVAELRRRSRSLTIGVRDRERANIMRLRVEGLGVEAVAERSATLIRSPSSGGRRVRPFSPKSNALAPRWTRRPQHEFLHGNSESGH